MSLTSPLRLLLFSRLFYVLALFGLTLLIALASPLSLGPVLMRSSAAPLTAPAGTVSFDFDDDNKADIGRWYGTNTEFKIRNSNGGSYTTTTIGSTASKPAPGDFDGDHKFDPATFNAGTWNIKPSGTPYTVTYGQSGDVPVVGDYDDDGISDVAVWRPSNVTFYVTKSSGGTTNYTLGQAGDIPMPGDYDNDGQTDYAVWRPSNGQWHIQGRAMRVILALHGAPHTTHRFTETLTVTARTILPFFGRRQAHGIS